MPLSRPDPSVALTPADLLKPEWAPAVPALITTRAGGVSGAPFDSLNLSFSVGDDPAAVRENRRRVEAALGVPIQWPHLVHGAAVARLTRANLGQPAPVADGVWTDDPAVACAVTAADCLPVLFATADGRAVGAAHAGWRGLAAGVLENTAAALCGGADVAADELHAWLGPCIGRAAFEVGADVLMAFGCDAAHPGPHFRYRPRADGQPRWLGDLPALARERLAAAGLRLVGGGIECTFSEPSRFFSFRRDARLAGRMVAAIAVRR